MEFSVGDSVEAVDQLGIWTKAKVVSKSDNAIVVNFSPWRAEWDREIIAPSEIRRVTPEETFCKQQADHRSFPNLKKLFQGDVVYVNGKELKVLRSDPIRKVVTVDLEGETCFNIWEVDGNKPLEEAQQLQENKRKRQKTQNHDTTTGERHSSDKSLPQEHVQPSNHAVPATEDLHFYFYVDKSGIVLTVGSLYSFNFCKDSVFICNGISKNKETFKFKFFLCFLGEGKVEGIDRSVCCTLNDMKHVLSRSDVVVGSKAKGLVDKIICEGWDRVLFCQVNNSENVSYLLHLRKSCLASQIR
ncbi:unnamed protein product [Pocillopora meandrina]|uniref:Uncharacterized protein n=1 Tax=Pocillopora meandrina TaxID=46732 RepID=A0AAU9W3D2_9CNID|nr:unnamed protein product [Pocillopora meandrina]